MRSEIFRLLVVGSWIASYYIVGFELTVVALLALQVVPRD